MFFSEKYLLLIPLLVVSVAKATPLNEPSVCEQLGQEVCCEGYVRSPDGKACIAISELQGSPRELASERRVRKKRNVHEERDMPYRYIPESVEAMNNNDDYIPESIERSEHGRPESTENNNYYFSEPNEHDYVPESLEINNYVPESSENMNIIPESLEYEGPGFAEPSRSSEFYSDSDTREVYNFASGESGSRTGNMAVNNPDIISYSYENALDSPSNAHPRAPEVAGFESGICPDEFIELRGIGCYFLSNEKDSFSSASQDCESKGGYLAEVNNSEEDKAIQTLIFEVNNDHHYLGGTDIIDEGRWIWEYSKEPIIYENWFRHEPNNFFNQDCLVLSSLGTNYFAWYDVSCNRNLHYVCETDQRKEVTFTHIPEIEHAGIEWKCPEGFIEAGCGSCYRIVKDAMTWSQADTNCASMKAYLAILDSVEENDALANILRVHGMSEALVGSSNVHDLTCAYLNDNGSVIREVAACHALRYSVCETDERVSQPL